MPDMKYGVAVNDSGEIVIQKTADLTKATDRLIQLAAQGTVGALVMSEDEGPWVEVHSGKPVQEFLA